MSCPTCNSDKFKDALSIIFDLASYGALDEDDVDQDEEALKNQYEMQQEALGVISSFLFQDRISSEKEDFDLERRRAETQ